MSKQAYKRLRKALGMRVSREPLPAYVWPGGYDIVYLCADGGCLCGHCVNEEIALIDGAASDPHVIDQQWQIVSYFSTDCVDDVQVCDHCNAELGTRPEPTGPDPREMPDPLGFDQMNADWSPNSFRYFVAMAMRNCWVPRIFDDHRPVMPLPVMYVYLRVSSELRVCYLRGLAQCLERRHKMTPGQTEADHAVSRVVPFWVTTDGENREECRIVVEWRVSLAWITADLQAYMGDNGGVNHDHMVLNCNTFMVAGRVDQRRLSYLHKVASHFRGPRYE